MTTPGKSVPSIGTPLLSSGVLVVDNFLSIELAETMRKDIDAHFDNPQKHSVATHQIWNYWFVPELYTYLRTSPEKIIRGESLEDFMRTLRRWSLVTLGMANVTSPYLSLYVPGCGQGWHNDAIGGRFAFVYSLTRDERHTTGGETLIMREGDPVRSNMTQPAAGRSFYEAVVPRFNRLVVFDDRLPHAVARVDGVMDPVEGRLVLHGHMSEAGMAVAGALPPKRVNELIVAALRTFATQATARVGLYHGPLVLRLSIDQAGAVESCDIMLDRVIHLDHGHVEWEPLRTQVVRLLCKLRFPPAAGETTVIYPIVFGGPLTPSR